MPAPTMTLLASSLLFPSFQFQEAGFEGFAVDTVPMQANPPFVFDGVRGGFGVHARSVVTDEKTHQPRLGSTARLRFRVDENDEGDTRVFWEDVTFGPGLLLLLARPAFGTVIDVGFGAFQADVPVWSGDDGRVRGMLFLPLTAMPLGLSNTDQDDDKRVKYYVRAGGGLGGSLIAGSGTFFLDLRLQGDYRWTWRAGPDSTSHHRGDAEALGELGLGLRTAEPTSVIISFFYQDRWQWDYDGAEEGLARSSQTLGGRLTFRTYGLSRDEENRNRPVEEPAEEEPPPPAESEAGVGG